MFDFEPPRTTETLRSALRKLHEEIASAVGGFSTEEFLTHQGEHWSPAEHLRHLVTAVRTLAQGMATPKLLLMLRFGLALKGSRSFEEVRELYRGALAAGGRASGRFDPATRKLEMEPEDLRAFVLQRWARAGDQLDKGVGSWSTEALDRYRAKHPLLGMMTIRELLYFTLYHNAHHARRIHERRVRVRSGSQSA
jgi:hypothetical protein